jgi:hypothetical protein
MNLQSISTYLAEANLGVEGETLFINQMPGNCNVGMLLRGAPSGTQIDHELPGLYKTAFQVICRAPDYLDGKDLADDVFHLLNVLETVIGDEHYLYLRPRHLPISYRPSDGDYVEWSMNFDVCYRAA